MFVQPCISMCRRRWSMIPIRTSVCFGRVFDVTRIIAALLTVAALASSVSDTRASTPGDSAQIIHITVLSAQPHSVSGGDALLRIDLPERVNLRDARVTLNRQDVTGAFDADDASHSLTGLLTGLRLGKNSLTASSNNSQDAALTARLTLTNYPLIGLIFSGPHQEPFICTTAQFK